MESNKQPQRKVACVSLGVLVERRSTNCWRNYVWKCNAGCGDITPNKECQTCEKYVARTKQDKKA